MIILIFKTCIGSCLPQAGTNNKSECLATLTHYNEPENPNSFHYKYKTVSVVGDPIPFFKIDEYENKVVYFIIRSLEASEHRQWKAQNVSAMVG